jgi:hypothetical protein
MRHSADFFQNEYDIYRATAADLKMIPPRLLTVGVWGWWCNVAVPDSWWLYQTPATYPYLLLREILR